MNKVICNNSFPEHNSLPLTRAVRYKTQIDSSVMEEKKKWCSRCHGGVLQPTIWPNELKCNYCGWSKTEINLADYLSSKGYVGP